MIDRRAPGVLPALVLVVGFSCAPGPVHVPFAMPVVSLTAADSGSVVDVQPGDSLEVRLAENPTTGYRWAVDQLEPGVLQLEDAPLERSPDAGVGAGGLRLLRFRVVGPGTSRLALKLWRDWEGDSSVIERFEATVRARGG